MFVYGFSETGTHPPESITCHGVHVRSPVVHVRYSAFPRDAVSQLRKNILVLKDRMGTESPDLIELTWIIKPITLKRCSALHPFSGLCSKSRRWRHVYAGLRKTVSQLRKNTLLLRDRMRARAPNATEVIWIIIPSTGVFETYMRSSQFRTSHWNGLSIYAFI